ncbi:MAG TPA: DUF2125 domain-containing protein [Roseomonas sp.]|jgi:hypothetical protein
MTAKPMRAVLGALLLFAGLAAAHSVLWRWAGGQLERGFATWEEQRRALGWVVEHGPPIRGGWPLAATLTVPGLRIVATGPSLPGGAEWQVQALVFRVSAPRIGQLVVEARGRQRLRFDTVELPFAADRLDVTLPIEAGVPLREAEIIADHLRMSTPAGPLELQSGRLGIETRTSATEAEPALALSLTLEALDLPPDLASQPALGVFGRRIESLTADAALTGPLPGGRDPVARAEQWRDNGGTLEVRSLNLRWGPISGDASATLTLDETLQPMGTATLRLAGAGEAIRALSVAGALTPRMAGTATAAVLLLQRPAEDGGPPRVELPLTLQERQLTAARVPVLRLAPIEWPRAQPGTDPGEDPTLPRRR